MKKALIIILAILFPYNILGQNKYISFLSKQETNSVEYINNLFKINDLVVICEREHPEITQYELFCKIISHPYFINKVGNIFLEVITCSAQKELDDLLLSENLPDSAINKRINKIYRSYFYHPLWTNTNVSFFLKSVYQMNQKLSKSKKIRVFTIDCENPYRNNYLTKYTDVIRRDTL